MAPRGVQSLVLAMILGVFEMEGMLRQYLQQLRPGSIPQYSQAGVGYSV